MYMKKNKKQYTVLIIDDDENVLDIYSLKFENAGHSVLLAGNGKDGLEIAFNKKPDIILLDVQMPDMRGTEVLERIRKDAWGKTVPVIMLTNLQADSKEIIQSMVVSKPDFYLIKADWEPKEVLEKVEEILS